MPELHPVLVGLTVVASFGGLALLIASAFVRRRWLRGGVWCFGLGLLLNHSGNFARGWLESLQQKAEYLSMLSRLSPADRAAPDMQADLAWAAARIARPPVDWIDCTMLAFAVLFAAVAFLRPEWVMLPQDRVRLGLDPMALRFGAVR